VDPTDLTVDTPEVRRKIGEMFLAKRRREDPLRNWTPTARQRPFITAVLEGPTPENYFIAANRAGKSEALAYCVAQLARFGTKESPNQPTSGWVISLDAPSSRDIIQPKIFDNGFVPPGVTPFIPDHDINEWRVSDQVLLLKNESIIGFKSSESGRLKFQGAGQDYIAEDEEQPESIHEEAVIRVGAGRKLRVFGAVTLLPPEGTVGGVSWMFPKIIEPWQSGDPAILERINIFGASIYDNPHLDTAEIRRLESIYPEGSNQRRIRLGGEWLPGMGGARMYGAFDRRLHVKPQPPLNPRRPLAWCWDFNVEPMVSLVGQRDGRIFRIYREFVMDEGQISEMVDWFRSTVPTHGAEIWIYGDATGKTRTSQTGLSDYQLILNHMRSYGVVKMKVPDTNPLVRDRVNAVNRAMKDEFGEVNTQIDPSCRELIADFEQVLSDGRGGIKKTSNRKDPYFRRTHTSDAMGYWVAYEDPVKAFTGGFTRSAIRVAAPGYAV